MPVGFVRGQLCRKGPQIQLREVFVLREASALKDLSPLNFARVVNTVRTRGWKKGLPTVLLDIIV